MTTKHYAALASARAQAMNAVHQQHCQPPTFRPAADVRASMPCPKCKGRLTYSACARTGRTAGQCSSVGCVTWRDL
ncbi:hypothetical protein [Variovorax sp. JS1663]|uniref:hypothetical protein n=1 Tax=Variovorax sp. JS1663 TaxID=1851577 RepID=UPI000B3444D4|nr:hypothetical protein [Variovorax sp. JS1663]OUM00530.1 hypothetical protein A8M77_20910 [Variovorax sp. JS1663]